MRTVIRCPVVASPTRQPPRSKLPIRVESREGTGDAAVSLLVTLGEVLVLVAGAILPFIWIVPLVWLFRRRRAGTPEVVETPDPEPEHDAELVDA